MTMSDESRELQNDLERATMRRLPPDAELSRAAAELREGWLAFEQLLDASDRAFDPRACLAKLDLTAAAQEPRPAECVSPKRRMRTWLGVLGAVVAASLLIVVAWGAWRWGVFDRQESGEVPVARQPANDRGPPGVTAPVNAAVVAAEVAWDDSFDEQLAVTQQRILQANSTSATSEFRLETLRQAVEQFDWELSSSSL